MIQASASGPPRFAVADRIASSGGVTPLPVSAAACQGCSDLGKTNGELTPGQALEEHPTGNWSMPGGHRRWNADPPMGRMGCDCAFGRRQASVCGRSLLPAAECAPQTAARRGSRCRSSLSVSRRRLLPCRRCRPAGARQVARLPHRSVERGRLLRLRGRGTGACEGAAVGDQLVEVADHGLPEQLNEAEKPSTADGAARQCRAEETGGGDARDTGAARKFRSMAVHVLLL